VFPSPWARISLLRCDIVPAPFCASVPASTRTFPSVGRASPSLFFPSLVCLTACACPLFFAVFFSFRCNFCLRKFLTFALFSLPSSFLSLRLFALIVALLSSLFHLSFFFLWSQGPLFSLPFFTVVPFPNLWGVFLFSFSCGGLSVGGSLPRGPVLARVLCLGSGSPSFLKSG